MKQLHFYGAIASLTLLASCQPIPKQALPEPVLATFRRDYVEARVRSVERVPQSNGDVHYRIKFLNRYDQPKEAIYDQQGSLVAGEREFWPHPRP